MSSLFPPGALVVTSSGCGAPVTLLRRLGSEAETTPGLTLRSGLLLDEYELLPAVEAGSLRYETWHVGAAVRRAATSGAVGYIPARASSVPDLVRAWRPDIGLIRVTPPSSSGRCSLGPSVSYAGALAEAAKHVVGEVDPALPWTCGDSELPVSAFDELVETEDPTPAHEGGTSSPAARSIGERILRLLPDAPTVQIGIGAIAEAFVELLLEQDVRDLRFAGMAVDAMVDLADRGMLARDAVVPDPAILAPEVLGTRRLMEFIHENPRVGMYPSTRSHDPATLGQRARLVSVQTALQVDLAGQVASERVAGRRIAGVGGSVDYAEAARLSEGGLRIVALAATNDDGTRSRIVPQLAAGETTLPSYLVDAVVTDHGVARLDGLSLEQRAEAMIEVAAPQHRRPLAEAWSNGEDEG